jgi:hypothetical protein
MGDTLIALEGSDQIVHRGSALIQALQGAAARVIVRDQTAPFDGCRGWKNRHWHI